MTPNCAMPCTFVALLVESHNRTQTAKSSSPVAVPLAELGGTIAEAATSTLTLCLYPFLGGTVSKLGEHKLMTANNLQMCSLCRDSRTQARITSFRIACMFPLAAASNGGLTIASWLVVSEFSSEPQTSGGNPDKRSHLRNHQQAPTSRLLPSVAACHELPKEPPPRGCRGV